MVKKLLLLQLVLALVAVFYVGTAQGEDPAGKKVFVDAKCNMCHSVEAAGITKKTEKGSKDLSGIGLTRNADWLTKYLQKKEAIDGKNHVKAFTGTEEDMKALVTWLESLKTEKK